MRVLLSLGRPALQAVCCLGSVYALLCHIPFTWTNFIADRRYPVLVERFLALHPWLLLGTVVLAWLGTCRQPPPASGERPAPPAGTAGPCPLPAGTAAPGRQGGRSSEATASPGLRIWLGLHLAACLWLAFQPLLPGLANNGWSLAWALFLWVPSLSLEMVALIPPRPADWGTDLVEEGQPLILPLFAAALFIFITYSLTHLIGRGSDGTAVELLCALGWDLAAHLLAAAAVALLLACALEAARMTPWPRQAGLIITHFLLWVAAACALKSVVLSSISFSGLVAWLYSACAAACPTLLSFNAAAACAPGPRRVSAWLVPIAFGLAIAPYAVYRLIKTDWAFVLATVSTMAVWGGVLWLSFRVAAGLRGTALERLEASRLAAWLRYDRWRAWRAPAAGLACVSLGFAGNAAFVGMDPVFRRAGLHPRRTLFQLGSEEPSFRALRGLFTMPGSSSEGSFFQLLQKHTNIPRSTRMILPEVELSTRPAVSSADKPDIFFFVIDSLRPDYLGAYNPAARFTPSFDAFAKESVVFKRAFSAYGGTGLSEPSLWSGSMLPHMQYPSPFRPVNSLEKLVQRQGYRSHITVDQVLKAVLEPAKDTVQLDAGAVETYKFCATLAELETKLAAAERGRPVFVYTQPQDIHVSVIEKEGRSSVSGDYPGFFSAYASRVARMDACFGRFVDGLKRSGRWEKSIVIVTADHGDSLGEGDRWGHAYTIYPEVISVPIMIHLPRSLAGKFAWDADAMALNMDITPSLYALLGQPPSQPAPFFGRSLFREASAAPLPPRKEQMVVSSYGPVYGILRDDGRSLYIADSTAYQECLFLLGRGIAGESMTLDDKAGREGRASIRRWIGDMERFFDAGTSTW
ncbi:MAG: sulfatase-like hydrolase/transferase [Elusimicrobia bacterium]|nr:sulfatase-like hydrolase/transferase [Elusimicrobiota bacterium]